MDTKMRTFNNVFKKLKKNSKTILLLSITLNIFFNIFFFRTFWHEIFFDSASVGARYSEVTGAQWGAEQLYQNVIQGKNPFGDRLDSFYPFGTNLLTTDSGNGFFMLFLRPFLSTNQAYSIIVASSSLFASIGMFLLLQTLGFAAGLSFVLGLVFGYMTFLMPRLAHLTYFSTFVFPWFFFSAISLFKAKDNKIKIVFSFLTAFFLIMSLYLNLYYFVMLVWSMVLLTIYMAYFHSALFWKTMRELKIYVVLFGIVAFVLLYPWLTILQQTRFFEGLPASQGWGGAIEYASDLFGYFIPSTYSYFLHSYSQVIGLRFAFIGNRFENFTYPGIVILLSYLILIVMYLFRRIDKKTKEQILPFFSASLFFLILTLGPFLHVFGKWVLHLDGVKVVVPLPYLLFHYVPFMSNIRSPGRLIVGFIFFACIVSAYVFRQILKRQSASFYAFFILVLFTVFFIDNYFIIELPPKRSLPYRIYDRIKNDSDKFSVLEIPFVARDGFTYFGSVSSLTFIDAQMVHRKPVLGGYLGRVPSFKQYYYKNNPLIGYIGTLSDTTPLLDEVQITAKADRLNSFNIEDSIDSVNFLDIKYIIMQEDHSASATASAIIASLGYHKSMQEGVYSLWQRNVEQKEFLKVAMGTPKDVIFLGMGWNEPEDGKRSLYHIGFVMLKIQKVRTMNLRLKASAFYQKQKFEVYINKKFIGTDIMKTQDRIFNFEVPANVLRPGINTIYFSFKKTYRPVQVLPGSIDIREKSAIFHYVLLEEIKNK